MKTKINRYITVVLLIILGTSCSDDFLQEKKNYSLYDDEFYQSQERVDWYINRVYYNFYYGYNSPILNLVGKWTDTNSYLTEERGGIQNIINPSFSYSTIDDIKNVTDYYGTKLVANLNNNPYTRIRDINSFLENVDSKGSNLDQTYRNQAKGQLYYMRAMQYFDLMRMYGGVPIVTTVQNGSSTDESIKLPRASVAEVVAQITMDLDTAFELLPNNWGAADYGRFTKGAALAQKSRVLLTYASPLFNKNWDTDNTRWQAALDAGLAAETQLTADGYGLYGTTAKQWAEMFLIDNAPCKEAITVKLLSSNQTVAENNGWEKGLRPVSQGGGGAFEAPKEMIDLFPMEDGSRPVPKVGNTGNYDPFIFFKGRDPRFYRTFTFSGDKFAYKENTGSILWAYRYVDVNDKGYFSDNNQESSPAFVRKMSNPAASNTSAFQYSATDIMEYRYAELLLNIAECYAALGDTGNTIAYLGKIRNRVGIPSANNYGIGTLADKYAAIEAVLYERRVELAYEGKRFWDVQRWMLYDDNAVSGIVNNTCSKLGLTPINGTKRTGHYLQYKNAVPAPVPANSTPPDPLAAQRALLSGVDPDSANFAAQIAALEAFYNNNFVLADLITPLDNYNNVATHIDWKPNYYINGLQTGVLSYNPWLEQTIGWGDASGSAGTFNYQN